MGNSVMLNGVEYAGEQIAYKDSTYELVSKVAYLIGVPLRIFQYDLRGKTERTDKLGSSCLCGQLDSRNR